MSGNSDKAAGVSNEAIGKAKQPACLVVALWAKSHGRKNCLDLALAGMMREYMRLQTRLLT
jgi:hypothetical protein